MPGPPYLSLVLACYNEEEILAESFRTIRETLDDIGRPYEIVFVDDVSRDRTREILRRIVEENKDVSLNVILHERNKGRGATVTDGFRAARGEIAGYIDVDLEVHPRYIPSLVRAIERGADVAVVRRIYAFQLKVLDRYFMSRGYSFLVRKLLGVPLRDTETGYKFFRREALRPSSTPSSIPPGSGIPSSWCAPSAAACARGDRRAYVRREDKTSTVRGLRDSFIYFFKLLAFRRADAVDRRRAEAAPRPARSGAGPDGR